MRPPVAAAFTFLLAACGGASPPQAAVAVSMAPPDERLSEILLAALEGDARLETADSLLAQDATFVADGVQRLEPPRFAGLSPGGRVEITSTRIEVRSGMAWAQVAYRWISIAADRAAEGRATFVLVSTSEGAWRIRHAHSSSPDS
ncbi:MAG TPA: nuclear transport factor 2 family protein [Gemmatimonadales bacterium]